MSVPRKTTLDDFQEVCKLGKGSFGTVSKVLRKQDEQIYVIKRILITELSYKEQNESINEVKLLAKMDSNYVVRYLDSFIHGKELCIVMEYCDKGDLQNLIKRAKSKNMSCIKEDVTWNIILQVILGLYYLHSQKVLHRDLKSANVFLKKPQDSDFEPKKLFFDVKIGDLGVSKLLESSTAFAQTIVGTPYYLSPELCSDQPYRDKSDCWALGILVYECCTLQHPFEAKNQFALIMKIIKAQYEPLKEETSSIYMRNMLTWLLQKSPLHRPTMRDLLQEKHVRVKLEENRLLLPVELEDVFITDYLSDLNELSLLTSGPLSSTFYSTGGKSASSPGSNTPVTPQVAECKLTTPSTSSTINSTVTQTNSSTSGPSRRSSRNIPSIINDHTLAKGIADGRIDEESQTSNNSALDEKPTSNREYNGETKGDIYGGDFHGSCSISHYNESVGNFSTSLSRDLEAESVNHNQIASSSAAAAAAAAAVSVRNKHDCKNVSGTLLTGLSEESDITQQTDENEETVNRQNRQQAAVTRPVSPRVNSKLESTSNLKLPHNIVNSPTKLNTSRDSARSIDSVNTNSNNNSNSNSNSSGSNSQVKNRLNGLELVSQSLPISPQQTVKDQAMVPGDRVRGNSAKKVISSAARTRHQVQMVKSPSVVANYDIQKRQKDQQNYNKSIETNCTTSSSPLSSSSSITSSSRSKKILGHNNNQIITSNTTTINNQITRPSSGGINSGRALSSSSIDRHLSSRSSRPSSSSGIINKSIINEDNNFDDCDSLTFIRRDDSSSAKQSPASLDNLNESKIEMKDGEMKYIDENGLDELDDYGDVAPDYGHSHGINDRESLDELFDTFCLNDLNDSELKPPVDEYTSSGTNSFAKDSLISSVLHRPTIPYQHDNSDDDEEDEVRAEAKDLNNRSILSQSKLDILKEIECKNEQNIAHFSLINVMNSSIEEGNRRESNENDKEHYAKMAERARHRVISDLGMDLFRKVYQLLHGFSDREEMIDQGLCLSSDSHIIKELQKMLEEQTQTHKLEDLCSSVNRVKLLLALEQRNTV